jgi:hypothetical protein
VPFERFPKTKEGVMKYAIMAMGLLVTPAQAHDKLNNEDCAQIEYIFDACSVSEKPAPCYMVHRAGAGESKSLGAFFDEHPNLEPWRGM